MLWRKVKEFAVITFGTALAAAAIYFFMLPSKVAVGSGSGIAMMLSSFIPLPVSVLALIVNVVLLLLGFLLIGPAFGAKTVYTTVMLPVVMGVYEWLFPNFQSLTNDAVLDILCYILLVSMAMALLFSRGASSGGLDIVAKILNKYCRLELGRAGALAGIAVALCSAFFYDTKNVVIAVLATYFSGMLVDHFIFGLDVKRRVCIISPKLDEVVNFLLHELHSGATLYEGTGAYDNTPRREVITIVDKQEYRRLMDFMRKTDPKAFITVYAVNEMRYQHKK